MKQNKKGFTLIELLAVIVILAIIALIATPIVLNMINQAKKSAARSAALGYIEAVEFNIGMAEIGNDLSYNQKFDGMVLSTTRNKLDPATEGIQGVYDGVWSVDTLNKPVSEGGKGLKAKVKGKVPVSGYILIQKRKVAGANLCMTDYFVQYTGKDADVARKCTTDEKDGNMNSNKYSQYFKEPNGDTSSEYSSDLYEPDSDPSASESSPSE